LRDRWTQLCGTAAVDAPLAREPWLVIEREYSAPARHYHTLEHISEVLSLLDALYAPDPVPVALELAGWWHDIVYDTTRSDNESASATVAGEQLSLVGFDAATVDRTAWLILTTAAHHRERTDEQALLFSDVDLAILGAPSDRYERYMTAVRMEYSHIDEPAWRRGRGDVLTTFLDRPVLYHHPRLHDWDARARHNLSAELARLR
jgi:predicted metal-dependent HD superfamily phosphohydrolase